VSVLVIRSQQFPVILDGDMRPKHFENQH